LTGFGLARSTELPALGVDDKSDYDNGVFGPSDGNDIDDTKKY
jgi:hypothetical protein